MQSYGIASGKTSCVPLLLGGLSGSDLLLENQRGHRRTGKEGVKHKSKKAKRRQTEREKERARARAAKKRGIGPVGEERTKK